MDIGAEDVIRLFAACVAGAIVGFERELHDKPAGFRTNIMICLGAALFTLLSVHIGGSKSVSDPGRIAAQIVTGVGFLGAGAIIQFRGNVVGLTTAATIWLVASVGMAFGAGQYLLGTVVTLLATGVLFALSLAEDRIAAWRTTAKFFIDMEPSPELSKAIKMWVRELGLHRSAWDVSKTADGFTGYLEVVGPEPKLDELQNRIMAENEVKSLRRL